MEVGADAYLTKPFNKDELLIRLRKLVELRKRLHERYVSLDFSRQPEDRKRKKEDDFIQKVITAIEKDLSNADFGTVQLCRALALSRTQLHNKLKALTGRSTSLFIRFIRLNIAKELLQNTDQNISEIAYDVGFKDPNYFTRIFVEEFGQPPSNFLHA